MRHLAYACLCLLVVLALSWSLPKGYDMAFLPPIDKTHLFFSPTLQKFIFTEQIRTHDAEAAKKSEGHHADILYKDEDKVYYDRLAFEAALPFIYFRNMEMRGLLPLKLGDKEFNRKDIEKARRVMELRARDFNPSAPRCLPLIESNPGQVALLYPADRFRMRGNEMHFTNADTNADDTELTRLFTKALTDAGFAFPARHVGGNFTTFKPREGGIFLVDSKDQLFHLMRQKGQPVLTKVELPAGVAPRHVLVSESKAGIWLGLVVDDKDRLWLLRQNDLSMVELQNVHYKPELMDCKVIFDPVNLTVLTSDEKTMYAAVYPLPTAEKSDSDTAIKPLRTISHTMSRSLESPQSRIADALFPFRIDFEREASTQLSPRLDLSRHLPSAVAVNIILALLCLLLLYRRQLNCAASWAKFAFIAVTGVYGLIPVLLLHEPE